MSDGGAELRELEMALAPITDGCFQAIPSNYMGVAMAATHALIRRGVKRLHLLTVPTASLQADLLIGAGAVAAVETSAVSFDELGPAPRFTAAVREGRVKVMDATCPAIHSALRASETGNPFGSLRGIIGSDILAHRPDWKVIDNPFTKDDPIVLLPALKPDVALFHAPMADALGNVWVGRRRDLFTIAHASATSIATVERIHDGNLLLDEKLAPATIPAFYVGAVAVAPRGAWPLRCGSDYGEDTAHLREYLDLAQSEEGFRRYLDRYVFQRRAA